MGRAMNCAHRGAMAYEPENTLRAFARAAEMGAEWIETDVRLTADGVAVISHDKIIKTEPRAAEISKITLAELRDLRFRGEPVPTLEELASLCEEKNMQMNIEIKDGAAVDKVVEMISRRGLSGKCQVSCFDLGALKKAKSQDHRIETAYLVVPWIKPFSLRAAAAAGCSAVNPFFKMISGRYVRRANRLGLKVNPWTMNTAEELRHMIEIGADMLINNRPDVCAKILKK